MHRRPDQATGAKVDLLIRRDRPFSSTELERRIPVVVDGVPLSMATAEDVILVKLEWARLGGSERQYRDIEGIVVVSGDQLDRAYLRKWANELGLNEELEAVLTDGRVGERSGIDRREGPRIGFRLHQ